MSKYKEMSKIALEDKLNTLKNKYEEFKAMNLQLNMARGRPCYEQLDLSGGINDCKIQYKTEAGTDCRNYGGVDGLPQSKELFAKILDMDPSEIIVGGNSSLNMMHDSITRALLLGVYGGEKPWVQQGKIKFICPSPGYDRHFAICELFGIEMITVDMKEDGPDMEAVENLLANDELIKGMWCVPQYSNPDGVTYSGQVVDRLAGMKVKAGDFRIFWDNAYCVHHLYADKKEKVKNILRACEATGNPDRVFIFTSTSKVTFAGAGISCIAASMNNIELIKRQISKQTIGPDKMNQLRHVDFLENPEKIDKLMEKHAKIIRPKFEAVQDILNREIGDRGIAKWSNPKGGYFVSFFAMKGCAKRIGVLANEAGLTLTPVGATYPYGSDPDDSNIRIAPTFPPLEDLKKAMELFALCVQIAAIEKLLSNK